MTALRIALPIAPATETHCGADRVGMCPRIRFRGAWAECRLFDKPIREMEDWDEFPRRLPECIAASTLPAEPWTEQRPEQAGEYWVALSPESRKLTNSDEFVRAVYVLADGYVIMSRFRFTADHEFFKGAKWMPRIVPADPFTKESA